MADDEEEDEGQGGEEEYFEPTTEFLKITDEQLAELNETYEMFDPFGNGSIPNTSLDMALKALGYYKPVSDLQEMTLTMDPNETGTIPLSKFYNLVAAIMNDTSEIDELREAFKEYDEDEDGMIATLDLRKVITSVGEPLTEEEICEMIREVDGNADGEINYEEFISLMTSK
ncbi:calmodulin-like [Agrilus planipennis]|uniref:Calmodulin-like n=1 Tax=Agrilus planipennis TaxID=224129 RepID=A0A1W4W3P5_AGRPL|nr:calmodulin-like [Agrilus planipennis]